MEKETSEVLVTHTMSHSLLLVVEVYKLAEEIVVVNQTPRLKLLLDSEDDDLVVLEVDEDIMVVNQTPRSKLLLNEEDDDLVVVVVVEE